MPTPDEGVREIQLSGKQLVFLFMAITVVSVVIFLCGVLVGRGVQTRPAVADGQAMAEPADDIGVPATDVPAAEAPTPAADVTFPERLEADRPPAETLTPKKETPRPPASSSPVPAPAAPAAASTPVPAAATTPPAAAAAAAARPTPGIPVEPKGSGFAIQVAALTGREEAETVVKRLTGKGYSAYLMPPVTGQPPVFRVRVGKFAERAAAEKVATRLEREERFKPWITR